jgi:hypothetical protein
MLQHIAPPRVFDRGGHVVGHEVEDEAEIVAFQRLDHALEAGPAAERGIEC